MPAIRPSPGRTRSSDIGSGDIRYRVVGEGNGLAFGPRRIDSAASLPFSTSLLALEQSGNKSEAFIHRSTLIPRHLGCPQMDQCVNHVSGIICKLSVRKHKSPRMGAFVFVERANSQVRLIRIGYGRSSPFGQVDSAHPAPRPAGTLRVSKSASCRFVAVLIRFANRSAPGHHFKSAR